MPIISEQLFHFKFQELLSHEKKENKSLAKLKIKVKNTYVNGKFCLSSHSYTHNRNHLLNQCIGHHCDTG